MRLTFILSMFLSTLCYEILGQNNMITITTADGQYLIYTPPSYDGSTAYPMLTYLHGAQAIGNDISCSSGKGLPGAVKNNSFFADIPMIIVAPYFNNGGPCNQISNNDLEWDVTFVNKVIDHVIDSLNIDEDRIFGSGISLGAKGLWDYVLAYPDRMAGIVPFSGNAPTDNICSLDEVAVWAFHGEVDGTIPPVGGSPRSGSQTVVEEINSCNDTPYLPAYITLLTSKGHNGWDQVYNLTSGYNIYEWMLALKKNVSGNYSPLVNIGPDRTFANLDHALNIKSFAFDPNGRILNYEWSVSGGETLRASGQPELTFNPSSPGVYNISLTVTDDEGNSSSDSRTIEILDATGAQPAITALHLYNGSTDLGAITNNQVVDLDLYNAEDLNIIAVTENLNTRASVRFGLNDNHNFTSQNENKINGNFSIGDNNNKSYQPTPGEHTIIATAYSDRNESGEAISYEVTLTYANGPLPIKLLYFNARLRNDEVELTWATAEEVDNSHFEILEGNGSAAKLKSVARIDKKEGSSKTKFYSHTLPVASCSKLYYQLKSVDLDGKTDLSKIVHINNNSNDCNGRFYPNPLVNNQLQFDLPLSDSPTKLTIINVMGTTVNEYMFSPRHGTKHLINLENIPSGIYILKIENNGRTTQERLIKK